MKIAGKMTEYTSWEFNILVWGTIRNESKKTNWVWKIEPLFYHWLRWKEHLIDIFCNLCDWWLQYSGAPISNVAIVNFWHYGKWIWTVLNKLVSHQMILYFLQQFERIIFECITARTITSFVDETNSQKKKIISTFILYSILFIIKVSMVLLRLHMLVPLLYAFVSNLLKWRFFHQFTQILKNPYFFSKQYVLHEQWTIIKSCSTLTHGLSNST